MFSLLFAPVTLEGYVNIYANDITERKKAEQELKKSEKDYSSLFANMIDGFAFCQMIFDDAGKPIDFVYLQVNDAFEKITGLKRELIIGKKISQAIPEIKKTNPELFEIYGRVALTGQKEKFEHMLKPLNLWLDVSVYSPNKGYFAAVLEDITERKKAEQELQAFSMYSRSLIEASLDPLVTISREGKITDVNKATEAVTGCSRSELVGSDFSDYFTDPESAKAGYQKVFTEGLVKDYPLAIRHKSGRIIDVLYNATTYRNAQEEVQGVFAAARDITERNKAEEARKESEKKYRTLVEQSKQGLLLGQGPIPHVVFANSAMETISGYSVQELASLTFQQVLGLVHPDDRKLFFTRFNERLQGKPTQERYTFRGIKKDGTIIWVELSSALIEYGGQPTVQAMFEDITERKTAEAEREIMIEFLRITNASFGTRDLIRAALGFFQKQSGCEAVGVRLKEDDDFPYFETRGFPPEHILLENRLCAMDEAGCVIRDFKGDPVIECMCGNILCGRFDPSKNFFTEKGSFWANDTTRLLASTTDSDRQIRTRNRCNGEGYESVALIALRVGDNRLGLLQLNDRRKNMFSLESIQTWERIADYLALALSKTLAEDKLREEDGKYRHLSENAPAAIYEIDCKSLRFKSVNDYMCALSGYSEKELLSMSPFDLLNAESKERFKEIIRKSVCWRKNRSKR